MGFGGTGGNGVFVFVQVNGVFLGLKGPGAGVNEVFWEVFFMENPRGYLGDGGGFGGI